MRSLAVALVIQTEIGLALLLQAPGGFDALHEVSLIQADLLPPHLYEASLIQADIALPLHSHEVSLIQTDVALHMAPQQDLSNPGSSSGPLLEQSGHPGPSSPEPPSSSAPWRPTPAAAWPPGALLVSGAARHRGPALAPLGSALDGVPRRDPDPSLAAAGTAASASVSLSRRPDPSRTTAGTAASGAVSAPQRGLDSSLVAAGRGLSADPARRASAAAALVGTSEAQLPADVEVEDPVWQAAVVAATMIAGIGLAVLLFLCGLALFARHSAEVLEERR